MQSRYRNEDNGDDDKKRTIKESGRISDILNGSEGMNERTKVKTRKMMI